MCERAISDMRLGEAQRKQRCGIQIDALPPHGQMQMGSGGAPRAAAQSDLLAFGNVLSFFYAELGEMKIEREQTLAVVNHNEVAFEVEWASEDHGTAIDCRNRRSGGRVEI